MEKLFTGVCGLMGDADKYISNCASSLGPLTNETEGVSSQSMAMLTVLAFETMTSVNSPEASCEIWFQKEEYVMGTHGPNVMGTHGPKARKIYVARGDKNVGIHSAPSDNHRTWIVKLEGWDDFDTVVGGTRTTTKVSTEGLSPTNLLRDLDESWDYTKHELEKLWQKRHAAHMLLSRHLGSYNGVVTIIMNLVVADETYISKLTGVQKVCCRVGHKLFPDKYTIKFE